MTSRYGLPHGMDPQGRMVYHRPSGIQSVRFPPLGCYICVLNVKRFKYFVLGRKHDINNSNKGYPSSFVCDLFYFAKCIENSGLWTRSSTLNEAQRWHGVSNRALNLSLVAEESKLPLENYCLTQESLSTSLSRSSQTGVRPLRCAPVKVRRKQHRLSQSAAGSPPDGNALELEFRLSLLLPYKDEVVTI